VAWRWDFGDGTIAPEKNPSHRFPQAGSYTVILMVTDNGGASDGSSAAVTVRDAARAQTTTTITSDSPDPSVAGKSITVRVLVTSPSGTPSGDVLVTDPEGGNCTSRAPSGSCTLKPGGVGPRTLTATYQGNSSFSGSSDTEQHRVNEAPQANNKRPEADFELECDDATLICVFLDESEDDDGTIESWFWEFGDGSSFNGRFPPPHQYADRTEYFVVLTVTDDDGATDARTRMVKLDD
jgi:PKD repeat protein